MWVNAHPVADRDVTAKIGDTVCATASPACHRPRRPDRSTASPCRPRGRARLRPRRGHCHVLRRRQQAAQTVEWHAGEIRGSTSLSVPSSRTSARRHRVRSEADTEGGGRIVPVRRKLRLRGSRLFSEQDRVAASRGRKSPSNSSTRRERCRRREREGHLARVGRRLRPAATQPDVRAGRRHHHARHRRGRRAAT